MISFIPPFESEHNFEIMSDYEDEENEYFNEGFFSIDKNDVPNFPESSLFYYHAPFHSIYCDFDELIEKKIETKNKVINESTEDKGDHTNIINSPNKQKEKIDITIKNTTKLNNNELPKSEKEISENKSIFPKESFEETTKLKSYLNFKIYQSEHKLYRTDNLRREAFNVPMEYIKQFFKKKFNLNIDSLKCADVLGTSICYMKAPLNAMLFQLFCYDKNNIQKIKDIYESKMDYNSKMIFNYFMTLTYKELYEIYLSNNRDFRIIKGCTIRISFISLGKAIKEKENKLKDENIDEVSIKKIIEKYELLSLNMIKDIEGGKYERRGKNEKKEKEFPTPDELKELGDWRYYFKNNNDSKGLELEE